MIYKLVRGIKKWKGKVTKGAIGNGRQSEKWPEAKIEIKIGK